MLGFVAAFLYLVNVAVIGRSYKGHLLNCLEDMISGEMKKIRNNPLLFDMVPRSLHFKCCYGPINGLWIDP